MKVIILSQIDYAGSAYKLFKAIKTHTDIDINLFSGRPENALNHPIHNLVVDSNRQAVQALVNNADILHFKGDWSPDDGYLGLKIPDKPIVLTTSGSFFRKREHGGLERYTAKDYKRATLKTSFEPDLLYPEYSDIWTPHPIDSEDKPMLGLQTANPIFMHIPSSPERKGTDFVKKLFAVLEKRIKCRTEVVTGVNFEKAQALKKISTIYFDQFFVGFYGNSALEAMQYGIPTAAWISPMAIRQAEGQLKNCPVINLDPTDAYWAADRVINALGMADLQKWTKRWCDDVHGYRAIAAQWMKLYTQLYEHVSEGKSIRDKDYRRTPRI